jgi:glucose-6-phosphate 1-dehydrogenase
MFDLAIHNSLGSRYAIVGFARTPMSDEQFRASTGEAAKTMSEIGPIDTKQWSDFASCLFYNAGDYNDPQAYQQLAKRLEQLDSEHKLGGNRLFYLSTPPEVYPHIVEQLGRASLSRPSSPNSWVRIIIEKPFGRDLASAQELNKQVHQVFEEQQVYRIDHYLGKDTVQNLLVLRFGNGIFEPLWNRNYVDSVQITASETLGVERRGGFYETAGALRDMIQSHVLQLTSLVAVEPPASFDATAVRNEKLKVLQCIRPFDLERVAQCVVRGQYAPSQLNGNHLAGYREEPGVNAASRTETFVAACLSIDNWRWAGVPFYLRTGKRLAARSTQIVIRFRRPPFILFRKTSVDRITPNELVINIQPNEGISLSFEAKVPGPVVRLGAVNMDFQYSDYFGTRPSTGYETLLYDCMMGDPTLFQRADMVEAGWGVVQPILDVWKALPPRDFPNYAAGSWGPPQAEELLRRDGREWRDPTHANGRHFAGPTEHVEHAASSK